MTTTFENARVGDIVYSLQYGWGTLCAVDHNSTFELKVVFKDKYKATYTKQGFLYLEHEIPDLYWNEPTIVIPEQPKHVKYKNVNGFKVPDLTIKTEPKRAEPYVYPNILHLSLFNRTIYHSFNTIDKRLFTSGLMYPFSEEGEQAAIAHAKAWLGEGEPWEE